MTTTVARCWCCMRQRMPEEYPMALHYLSSSKEEKETYTFSGPVASYAGIGRFVMGLIDEIKIVSPEEFREYVRGKVGKEMNSGSGV